MTSSSGKAERFLVAQSQAAGRHEFQHDLSPFAVFVLTMLVQSSSVERLRVRFEF
jgi:hypothetical protein